MESIKILNQKAANIQERNFLAKMKILKMVKHLSDEEIEDLNRGGHDPIKVFNAYKRASESKGKPSVVLAFTVKGYGMGSRQADNAAHQVKKTIKRKLKRFY